MKPLFNFSIFFITPRSWLSTFAVVLFSYLQKQLLFVVLFLLVLNGVSAQEDSGFILPDSLQQKTYTTLRTSFERVKNDSLQRVLYAESYLAKATKEKDVLQMTIGYELLGIAHKNDYRKSFRYYDKGIALSKTLKHERYPAVLYTYKGAVSYSKGNYKEALENYLQAIDYTEMNENLELLSANKHNVGILKKRLELHDEALLIFKESYQHDLQNPNRDPNDFMRSYLALADVYTLMHQVDSSRKYNSEGIKIASKENDTKVYNFLVFTEGRNLFLEGNYQTAIDSLSQTISNFVASTDKLPLIDAYLFLGKAHDSLQQKEIAISYYKKVDSVFSLNPNHISTRVMESYDALYSYYKEQEDKTKAVFYIEKALFASSQLSKDYRRLSAKIAQKYDRRVLLSKQKQLNEELENKDKQYNSIVLLAIVLFAVFLLILIGFYSKQQRLRKRFQEFVKAHETSVSNEKTVVDKLDVKEIGVPEEVINQLLEKLQHFEIKNTFITNDITLTGLAKKFQTNSAYLSKVINTYKNKKFAAYLNDLRIDYAIDKIQNDSQFLLYTIKAIALEVGFNNSQSFARAFKRKTKMQPSDFIQQVKHSNS
ncbi:helix-turn-helix domain-containing protein [Kordia sp. YSTF-M3]|uniref:Helix-turn-helix domain-containing protein n=1 Tax=Kordia aestuariivivens TaxID=2759037 RepID=A0ABR7Q3D1_9FLAO|nr:helix-turn-helix domain-containing protein [Kordia aestuariivivens]MBC8753060.1 helix-turn-helix domain-containing protein [Kordia aestuariivivens]